MKNLVIVGFPAKKEKFEDLKNSLGNIGENKLLLITSIKVMDEYFETKKKIEEKKKRVK